MWNLRGWQIYSFPLQRLQKEDNNLETVIPKMAKLAKELPELIQKVCADFVSYIGIYYMTREYECVALFSGCNNIPTDQKHISVQLQNSCNWVVFYFWLCVFLPGHPSSEKSTNQSHHFISAADIVSVSQRFLLHFPSQKQH